MTAWPRARLKRGTTFDWALQRRSQRGEKRSSFRMRIYPKVSQLQSRRRYLYFSLFLSISRYFSLFLQRVLREMKATNINVTVIFEI